MRRLKLLASTLLLVALAGGLVAYFTVDAFNSGGRPAGGHQAPKRIVSLVPSNTEILFALGLGDRVVGVTRYCNYPPAARSKPKVGDMNASAETVVSMKPDLVVAHATLNSRLTSRLGSLGIRVAAIDPRTFGQLYSDIRKVGDVTGRSGRADSIVRSMNRAVSDVRRKTAHTRVAKALVVIQPNPLWAAGPGTFVDEMLADAHATNVAHDARRGFNLFSTEVAVSRNPDVIIVSRRQERDFIMQSPLWKRTSAVRRKAVYVVDGDLMLRPGPRLSMGLMRLARAIHPEAFK